MDQFLLEMWKMLYHASSSQNELLLRWMRHVLGFDNFEPRSFMERTREKMTIYCEIEKDCEILISLHCSFSACDNTRNMSQRRNSFVRFFLINSRTVSDIRSS